MLSGASRYLARAGSVASTRAAVSSPSSSSSACCVRGVATMASITKPSLVLMLVGRRGGSSVAMCVALESRRNLLEHQRPRHHSYHTSSFSASSTTTTMSTCNNSSNSSYTLLGAYYSMGGRGAVRSRVHRCRSASTSASDDNDNDDNNDLDDMVFLRPRISVIGIGGAGSNTIDNMLRRGLTGINYVVANTDAQALSKSIAPAECKVQIGRQITNGLGAGAKPAIGQKAAEEDLEVIMQRIGDSHMLFITAGMGGGTGTGAAPVIARAARAKGILTVGIVTKPFDFEGRKRTRLAEEGLTQLKEEVDTLIVIPNQKVISVSPHDQTFNKAFERVNNVLYDGVKAVTDVIIKPGLINLDFADVRTIASGPAWGLMGSGSASGKDRAKEAALAALNNPLLDHSSRFLARGVLISVVGGQDMGLLEVDAVVSEINKHVDNNANIIFGAATETELEGKIQVSLIVTGPWEEKDAADGVATDSPAPAASSTTTAAAAGVTPTGSTSSNSNNNLTSGRSDTKPTTTTTAEQQTSSKKPVVGFWDRWL